VLINKKLRVLKKLTQDKDRIQEAVLYVMNLRNGLSQYDIVKTLFLADKSHMNLFGRPVTFDNYVAMENGPVPSLAYDALKPNVNYKSRFGVERPWTSIPDKENSNINRFTPLRKANEDYLSRSDIKSLRNAFGTVSSSTFDQLKRLTHEDNAYKEAWGRRGNHRMSAMKIHLLVEKNGEGREEDIIYMSL
jgi:uncharacterized phage-associated protein